MTGRDVLSSIPENSIEEGSSAAAGAAPTCRNCFDEPVSTVVLPCKHSCCEYGWVCAKNVSKLNVC